ncbi:MAG: septum site-determining protein MinD, partial [Clostridia bacterium]|nr:septum site-determining protein MinD [Clostridia bacterium]
DTDIGLRNLDIILGMENKIVYDIVDVCDGSCDIKKATIHDKRFENLYLIPASQAKDKESITPLQMKNFVNKAKGDYDYIIIDCPAGLDRGFEIAVAGADRAIVVTVPELASVRDADRIAGLLEKKGISNVLLAVNKMRQSLVEIGCMLSIEEILDTMALELVGVIPTDDAVIKAANCGIPCVCDVKSKAGRAYGNIAMRVCGEKVPLADISEKKNIFEKIAEIFKK